MKLPLPRIGLTYAIRTILQARRTIQDAARQGGVSSARVLRELFLLNATRQMGFRVYFQYRLFYPRLSLREKAEYLPDSKWASRRLWDLLTPRQYHLPFRNKLFFNRVFSGEGLPVARVLGTYDPKTGRAADGRPLRTAEDLRRWFRESGECGFVFKPVWGIEGHQVLVFTGWAPEDPETMETLAGERYDAEQLVRFTRQTAKLRELGAVEPEAYLLEERLRPHPALAELIGPTLCCVRVVTVVGLDGVPMILGAVYKIQPKPIGIDHLVYGALGSWVDLETGTLGPGRSRFEYGWSTVIPGTDREFVGFQLPHWPEVKTLAVRAASVLPAARAVGWDIAVTDRGPFLIEGNAEWSTSLLQIPAPHGLMTGEFKELCQALAANRSKTG